MKRDEIYDSVSPALINLKSFICKDHLNEKIWSARGIRPEVRLALLQIAKEFIDSLGIDWANPVDIIVVGSITGYNWSKYSDIDLHLVYDFSHIDDNIDFVKNYFDAKKTLWNNQHEDLKIHGYEVELYVLDVNEENATEGQYSLVNDIWVSYPKTKDMHLNNVLIKTLASKIINIADELYDKIHKCNDLDELEKLLTQLKELYKGVTQGRRDGLAAEGESSPANIVFKVLRRSGHLDKMRNLKYYIFDKMHSL